MPPIGYLNGRFSPLEQVCISPEDRGYLFGDGVYEVIRAYHGKPAFWEDHFSRLLRSAGAIKLPLLFEHNTFFELLESGIGQSGYSEAKIYVQVTRGVAPRDHAFPSTVPPTVFMAFSEMSDLPEDYKGSGVRTITVPDIRWGRCDIKSLNLLPNVLAKQQAREAHAFEAIFIREGRVMEGATSNLFMVRHTSVVTPLINHQVLAGVTQQKVLELSRHMGGRVECRPISLEELRSADEVFLTGTTIEVLPVKQIDDHLINGGRPGVITKEIQEKFGALLPR